MTSGAVGGEDGLSFVIEDRFRHDGARRIPRAQEQNVVVSFHVQSQIPREQTSVTARRTTACLLRLFRFHRAHKGAHELLIDLRRDGIHVNA